MQSPVLHAICEEMPCRCLSLAGDLAELQQQLVVVVSSGAVQEPQHAEGIRQQKLHGGEHGQSVLLQLQTKHLHRAGGWWTRLNGAGGQVVVTGCRWWTWLQVVHQMAIGWVS